MLCNYILPSSWYLHNLLPTGSDSLPTYLGAEPRRGRTSMECVQIKEWENVRMKCWFQMRCAITGFMWRLFSYKRDGESMQREWFYFCHLPNKKAEPNVHFMHFQLCSSCTFCSALREAVLLYCYTNQEGGGRGLIHSNALWHLHTTVDILNNNKSDLKILSKISVFQELQS